MIKKWLIAGSLVIGVLSNGWTANLIPKDPVLGPDYFCTWNIECYYVNYVSSTSSRLVMDESSLFGTGQYQNWISFYPRIRKDLTIVLDDGWDIDGTNEAGTRGSLMLFASKWPSYTSGTQQENLKKLTQAAIDKGWGGLGIWLQANMAANYSKNTTDSAYYTQRAQWANYAGINYWKVDYGSHTGDLTWRRLLTSVCRTNAPKVLVEHCHINSLIAECDAMRTYDLVVIGSIPITLQRISNLLVFPTTPGAKSLINCEDEPYMAAALGCAMGIMRHPYVGNLPNGKQDIAFPPINKDVKRCLDEVNRCVFWHRIAPPFGVSGTANERIDNARLIDAWYFLPGESWDASMTNKLVADTAPARIARGMDLPMVTITGDKPFVGCARNPNGAISVGTWARTFSTSSTDRRWVFPLADVEIVASADSVPIGIFGKYKSLKITFANSIAGKKVIAQDLLDSQSTEITSLVAISGSSLTIPGTVIDQIGLSKATANDKSDPGLVMKVVSTVGTRVNSTVKTSAFAKSNILTTAGDLFTLPTEFAGKTSLIMVYDISGKVINSKITKNSVVNLRTEMGLTKGTHIIKVTLVRYH